MILDKLENNVPEDPTRPGYLLMYDKKVIYFLIDNNYMVDDDVLDSFNEAVEYLISTIREKTSNKNTFIKVLCVNSEAHWMSPEVNIFDFQWSKIVRDKGEPSVDSAFALLDKELASFQVADGQGIYYIRPSIVYFTSSYIENYEDVLDCLSKDEWFRRASRMVITAGRTNREMVNLFANETVLSVNKNFKLNFVQIWNNECYVPHYFEDDANVLLRIEFDSYYEGVFKLES